MYVCYSPSSLFRTTLLLSINITLSDLRTEYVDSGSNVDPVHEAKIVFTHLLNATSKTEEECKAMLDQLKFTPEMMKGSIGELSGGWQMKLRLAQAVLIDADILLLDEPIVTTGYYSTATLIQTSNPDRIISYIERCSYSSELSLNSI
jgi:ABC-type branched-subunit amino acid transport system ATPase component